MNSKKEEILYMHSKGFSQKQIANRLGITQPAVSLCLKRADIKLKTKHPFEIEKRITELKKKRDKCEICNHSHFIFLGMIQALEWVLSDTKKKNKK